MKKIGFFSIVRPAPENKLISSEDGMERERLRAVSRSNIHRVTRNGIVCGNDKISIELNEEEVESV